MLYTSVWMFKEGLCAYATSTKYFVLAHSCVKNLRSYKLILVVTSIQLLYFFHSNYLALSTYWRDRIFFNFAPLVWKPFSSVRLNCFYHQSFNCIHWEYILTYQGPRFTILTSKDIWTVAWYFQQCGILTCVDSDEPVQPPFKLRNSKWCSVSSLTIIEYSID